MATATDTNHSQPATSQPKQPAKIDVTFGHAPALYMSQFVLTGGDDEVLIDCSSGIDRQPGSGQATLPVHTRLAMPWSTARQLAGLLTHVIQQHDQRQQESGTASDPVASGHPSASQHNRASLPQLGSMNA